MRERFITFVWIAVLSPIAPGQSLSATQPSTFITQNTHFEYRVEPLVDLYNYVREQALRREKSDSPPEFDGAVAAARKIGEKLGANVLFWHDLDEELLTCRTAAELRRAFEQLPDEIENFRGEKLAIRAEALAFADALTAVESLHREKLWPAHQKTIQAAQQAIAKDFQPKESACVAFMLKSLAMDDPHDTVPVYLVQRVAWPGAYTIRRPDGGGVCFISVGEKTNAGSLLFETILHEATHALDVRAENEAGVLGQLRARLIAAGVKPESRELRDIPHTLMFIQAGETVRRIVNPEHKHYGEASGYYARIGRAAEVERPLWVDYLDGKLMRAEVVERIVVGMTKPAATQNAGK